MMTRDEVISQLERQSARGCNYDGHQLIATALVLLKADANSGLRKRIEALAGKYTTLDETVGAAGGIADRLNALESHVQDIDAHVAGWAPKECKHPYRDTREDGQEFCGVCGISIPRANPVPAAPAPPAENATPIIGYHDECAVLRHRLKFVCEKLMVLEAENARLNEQLRTMTESASAINARAEAAEEALDNALRDCGCLAETAMQLTDRAEAAERTVCSEAEYTALLRLFRAVRRRCTNPMDWQEELAAIDAVRLAAIDAVRREEDDRG